MKHLEIPEEIIKDLKSQSDVEDLVGGIYKQLVERMLQAEMSEHLGYEKNDRPHKKPGNSRNGSSKKTVKTSSGPIQLEVPRDRQASFEPIVVAKHERMSSKIEQVVISLYAKGLSVRDIEQQIREIYGVQLSASAISNITDSVVEHLREWQSRPLEEVYFVLWIDGIVFKVRQNGKVINKTVYVVIGLSNSGKKEILGLWINETESATFWMNVFADMQARGVQDVLLVCSDNLSGISKAIASVFPQSQNQLCIVHPGGEPQIRNATKYVSWKDRKAFIADMKHIYQAPNMEGAQLGLKKLKEKWGEKYPHSIRSWETNWEELTVYFDYPAAIRKLIYTTNVIESFNSQLRRNTSKKSIFTNDDAVLKSLYLTVESVSKKWQKLIPNWGIIANQFLILFEDRCRI